MRTKLLNIIVILFLAGSGDARPQKTEEPASAQPAKSDDWKPFQPIVPRNAREDSRYRWNSGSSRISYTNYYHNNNNTLVNREGKVSVNETDSRTRYSENDPRISLRSSAYENLGRLEDRPQRNGTRASNRQTLKLDNDRKIRNDNSGSRDLSYRQFRVPSANNATSFPVTSPETFDHKSGLKNTRDRHPNSRVSSTDSEGARDKSLRRSGENNSRPTLVQNSGTEFSVRKGFSSTSKENSFKVESSTPFDHVAVIKRITSTLINRQNASTKIWPLGSKNSSVALPSSRFPSGSNRHTSSKHSNRNNARPNWGSQSNNTKKGHDNKPNKTFVSKNNTVQKLQLKNWPNGAIQNADDLHNYEKYTALGENLQAEETTKIPVSLNNSSFTHNLPPNLQEIMHWLKIPAFGANHSHLVENDRNDGPVSVIFDPVYQNLEPNRPLRPSNAQTFEPNVVYPENSPGPAYASGTTKGPAWLGKVPLRNQTNYGPQSQVSQNTVVHVINLDPRKPNRTIIQTKVPGYSKPSTHAGSLAQNTYPPSYILTQLSPVSSTTPKPGPNVHIAFTSFDEMNKSPDEKQPQPPVVTYDHSCPTILINSYTRINNTIQSKEGCTDLNIIINSHVFNTNLFKPSPPSFAEQSYAESDKYSGPGISGPSYQPTSPQWPQSVYHGSDKVPGNNGLQTSNVSPEISNVEVFQDTQISISNSPSAVSPSSEAFEEPVSPTESSEAEFADEYPPAGPPGPEVLDASPVLSESTGQPNDLAGLSSASQQPAVGTPNPGSSAASPSSATNLASSPAPAASSTGDDDDDDYDLSPSGIMESIASVFTYFTLVNPLHYGFFSLAAAPFTALAAGVLGIVAVFFPWVLPNSLNFARSYSRNANSWPSLEEVVRQSMYKYGRLDEWKSRRKKRKR